MFACLSQLRIQGQCAARLQVSVCVSSFHDFPQCIIFQITFSFVALALAHRAPSKACECTAHVWSGHVWPGPWPMAKRAHNGYSGCAGICSVTTIPSQRGKSGPRRRHDDEMAQKSSNKYGMEQSSFLPASCLQLPAAQAACAKRQGETIPVSFTVQPFPPARARSSMSNCKR